MGLGCNLPRLRQARRGNGARIRLSPQKDSEVNQPAQLAKALETLEGMQRRSTGAGVAARKLSLRRSDRPRRLGRYRAGREKWRARRDGSPRAGPRRRLARANRCGILCLSEPCADGFRNYLKARYSVSAEELLIDKAQLLTLTASEMTVLVGGLRVLGANHGKSRHGVFTIRPETLTNDFFVNLLDMSTEWKATSDENVFEGHDCKSGKLKWTGTRSTSSSARTPSCAPLRESTGPTTREQSS